MCRQIKRGMDHKTVPNLPQEYNKTEYTYDYVDNVLTVTTDKSRNLGKPYAVKYTNDYANRPVSETNIDGAVKTTTYDGMGRKTAETDFLNKTMQYAYDASSRVVKVTAPFDGSKTTDTKTYYDANGNQIRKTDSEKGTAEYIYDGLGQLKNETIVNNGQTHTISYDYDSRGNRVSMENGGIISRYTYTVTTGCQRKAV